MTAPPAKSGPGAAALLAGGWELLRHVFARAGRGASISLLFLLLGAIVEGISILLVIPLLTVFETGAARQFGLPLIGDVSLGLEILLGGVLVLVIAKALFTRMRSIYIARVLIDLVNSARLQLFQALGKARWEFLSRHRASDLNHLMTIEVDRLQGGAFNVLLLLQTILLLAVYLAVSAFISLWMTTAAAGLGLFVLAVLAPVRRMASRYGQRKLANRRAQYATIGEFLSGLKLAKSFNAEAGYGDRLAAVLAAMRSEGIGYARLSSTSMVVSQIVSALAVAAIVLIGARVLGLSLPYMAAILLILLRTAPQFLALQNAMQELIVYLPAFSTVRELQDSAEAHCEADDGPATAPIAGPVHSISFDAVGFRYPDQPEPVLDAVTFSIPAGRITAIVGPSGAGKSTLADLLLGMQRPTVGRIMIDGVELSDANRRCWRDCTGYVSQEVFLMHESIAANLRLARPEANEAELWRALEQASAMDFVAGLPDGLETVVGDRGARLSGGERQRIAFARALLREPRLLVLDEATSALDWENQQAIAQVIAGLRGHYTIVTIAHRPSMIAFADHVVALDRGRVVEEGAYEELIRKPGSALTQIFAGEKLTGNVASLRSAPGLAGNGALGRTG